MSIGFLVGLVRNAVYQVFIMTSPVLGAALIIGLIVAIFQATTSIQEQTLTFLPKMLVILGLIALLGDFMFGSMHDFTVRLFSRIPELAS